MRTMDSSEFATRGEREEGGGMAFHPASSNAPLTAVEEIRDQLKREIISGSRVSRRESSSRSSGRRVDSSGARGLLRVAEGAAAFGMLLIAVMTLRFMICLGALGLHRTSRQDISGTTPRALADEVTPLAAAASPGGLDDHGTLYAACPGYFGNPAFEAEDQRPSPSRLASRVPDSPLHDSRVRIYWLEAPSSRRERLRAWLTTPAVQLGFLVIGLAVAAMVVYSVGFFEVRERQLGPLTIVACILTGLAVTVFVPFMYKIRQESRVLQSRQTRPQDV